MRDKLTANSKFSGLSENPGAIRRTINGIPNSIIKTNTVNITAKTEMACEANFMALSLPSPASFCDTIGTNADVKAPSAKRLRNKFGNLNATKKASAIMPAPKKRARTISLMNPVIRLSNVKLPNVAMDLNKDIFLSTLLSLFIEF